MAASLNLTPNFDWYSPETGIYRSIHPYVDLPSDPFLDIVSFISSSRHNGISALVDASSGSSISYSELYVFVKSMASRLSRMGVSQGDVVLVLLPNSIYYPVVLLGILYLGAIVTTMNPLNSVAEIKKQCIDCNVCLAFSVPENVAKLNVLGVQVIVVPDSVKFDSGKGSKFSYFYGLIYGGSDLAPRPVIKQQDTAAIMYSSGTTGVSKGVVLTHRNFIAMIELFVRFEASQYDNLNEENVYLDVIPMFHIYGLSLFGMGLLALGSTVVVMKKFDISEVVKAIDRYKVTHFPVVPPILTALTRTAKASGSSLKSLKQVSCGAAPLSKRSIEELMQTLPHIDFIQGYGMTESTALGTRGFNTKKFQKHSSVGLLAPNMQSKVVDWNTGSFLPPGCCGELWLQGPGIMEGYLNNVEATSLTIDNDGWLHTGDIVYFDQDGFIHILDRLKEIIKYKGFQIAPADLEAVLISHPDIIDAAVTASLDEECGELPVAFVVKKHGSELSKEAVMDFVAEQVAPYKKVRKVVFTHSIPKSPAGKILRRELRNLLTSRL